MPFDLSLAQFAETERALGITFPSAYRTRLLKSNGGSVADVDDEWELIPFKDSTTKKRLLRTANHLLVELREFEQWTGWPKNAIPIAVNGLGDALVFVKHDDRLDQRVFVWRHESKEVSVAAATFSCIRDI